MILNGLNYNHTGGGANQYPLALSWLCAHTPVTLLSPLSPSKKGANALYIVTLKKGCKRPVHRHSVTLTP